MRRYQSSKKKNCQISISNLITGILTSIFLISLGLIFAINFRFLYYLDIKWFHLESITGFSHATIKSNYNALIDYCSPFYQGSLRFPSMPASASGLSHFAEVKTLFNAFYILFASSFLLLLFTYYIKLKKGEYNFLRTSSIISIVLPLVTLLACAIDFDRTFVIFHKIFFRNNDWMFDPVTDPIINILPQEFFLQCCIIIILTVLVGSGILFLCYRKIKRTKCTPILYKKQVNYYY